MKTFIFTETSRKATYGSNVQLIVFRVKNNIPTEVGVVKYNTQSYRGEINEVARLLVDVKELPKTALKGGYVNYDKLDKDFKIIAL